MLEMSGHSIARGLVDPNGFFATDTPTIMFIRGESLFSGDLAPRTSNERLALGHPGFAWKSRQRRQRGKRRRHRQVPWARLLPLVRLSFW